MNKSITWLSLFSAAALAFGTFQVSAETAGERNFFERKFSGSRTDFAGSVGYGFTAEATFTVTALGRSVSGEKLRGPHTVTLWSVADKRKLASVAVTPESKTDTFGFAREALPQPVKLESGKGYRITSSEEKGGDPMVDIGGIAAHIGVATVLSGVFSGGVDSYPADTYGKAEQGYGVPTFFIDSSGLEAALLKVSGTEAKPFVRDVVTGYLLNCSFLSPKPYCWPGNDDVLSGWDVDTGGGRWFFQPDCHYPDGFAFHSDWFKLVDTNSVAAVTLKHQIARQTEGRLTLEFRFKLPARMDGVCWQLRDLEQAGVSMVTSGSNLCWETGSALMPYETNREYGVKVNVEIASKKADVYVDGELKAGGLPFVNPVKSIDCFLVRTGVAATGELFLNPINIYKGYGVNETFVTCGVGKVPADWEASGAGVQPFECGTKPDIFSLRVTGQARRRIEAWQGKTVFECRFLFPQASDGVSVELGGVELAKAVPYRTNFWYMAKAIADPKTRKAEVFINGKPLPEPLTLPQAKAFLKFAGPVLVDDVQVYPWRDYPSDYVPEPKPVEASHLLGVQSCNLWREGTAYAGWAYVYPYRDKRKPYLGWYDEGNPEETDWEIKWKAEHGIAFEQHCWYRPNNAVNHPIKDGVLDQGIVKGLFNARYSHLAKFTIMFTDEGAGLTNPQDWRENIIPYWIDYFFKDPRYLKIDGKPVLSIYHLNNLQAMFGGKEGTRQAIQTLREEVAKAGFPGLIVLMECRGADRGVMQTMKAIGVDACYAYTWGTPDAGAQRNNNLAQREAAKAEGFGMLPSLSMGWDREAWGVREGGWLPPGDYKALAQWAKDEFMPGLPADSLGRRMVMLANWNEFGEGHFLMPSALAGFGYVDALREVFTAGGPHADEVPTQQQKRRFTALFPKD